MTQHIGTRIAYWRRRRGGMTQAALAGLAGVSQSYVSQVEAGHKNVERRATLVALAAALQVTVADLLGQPGDPTNPGRDAVTRLIPAIRAAIVEIEEGEQRHPARGRDEVDALLDRVDAMRGRSEYVQMAALLPELLHDAAQYGGLPVVRAAYQTSECLSSLGHRDLARSAARIAVGVAGDLEDPAWLGAARFVHTLSMPIEAAGTTARVAERAIGDLQARAADESVRQVLGQIHLSASLVCAVAGRPDTADSHLAEARREAVTLGEPADGIGFNLCGFGPINIALWQMCVGIERGEYGRVIELARTFTPGPLKIANRHQSYWMSLGRALAHSGKTDREALIAFMHAERAAPVPFALNSRTRDAVVSMVYRANRRSVSADLRVMARHLGVDVAV